MLCKPRAVCVYAILYDVHICSVFTEMAICTVQIGCVLLVYCCYSAHDIISQIIMLFVLRLNLYDIVCLQ